MKVGFLGAFGTFSEIAVKHYFKDISYEACNYKDFATMIQDVGAGLIQYAMLPVENTTTGSIFRAYDLLKDANVYAVGEQCVRIDEHLITLPGVKIEDIKQVYSHPEPIEQCQGFFKKYPWIQAVPYQDTAKSVEFVKEKNDRSIAALASYLAAEHYHMPILMERVQDNQNNITRFFCITNEYSVQSDANKISLMLTLNHEPGALFRVVEVFAKHHINMVKLESRPIPGKIFEYCFYLDISGNVLQADINAVLESVKSHCIALQVLGCYRKYEVEELL